MSRLAGLLAAACVATSIVVPVPLSAEEAKPAPAAPAAEESRIDLAILLDTSGSMEGLINQARTNIWKVVNDLATAEKNGKTPHLRVALYEYGNSGLPADGGYVRQILPLTDDLDKVSEQLFALSTNGGDEYCGRVIEAATQGLDWGSDDDLKVIVIAGNEPFTQGPVDYKTACPAAVAKGIVVNTIFCGPEKEGIETGWADGAKLADGKYAHIDQDAAVAEIPTPFDAELARLGGAVNTTYLFFGRAEMRKQLGDNQVTQDANAASAAPSAAADRAAAKAGAGYNNEARDLIDALKKNEKALEELEEAELPDDLKDKTAEERKAIVAEKAAEREKIQKQIQELADKRAAYIVAERKKQAEAGGPETLDAALVKSLREQAGKKDYTFKK